MPHADPVHSSSLDDSLARELAELRSRHLERQPRVLSMRAGATVHSAGSTAVDFSSNDYLGLASDRRLADAAMCALRVHGTGATASRLIAGTNPEHVGLERDLAGFFGTEAALTFSTGYAANTGIIPALVGRDDVVFADQLNHASLIDGCRLSRATVHVYAHNSVDELSSLLSTHRARYRRALMVTDGMFSMDGDTAPLVDIVSLARQYDAWTYVDDAHAVGVSGAAGRGTAEALGVHGEVDVNVATLGKAFGAAGAFVAGSSALCTFLLNRARSFIFSTAPIPAQAAAARAALSIVRDEPQLRMRLFENARVLRNALRRSGLPVLGDDASHIVPVMIGDAERTMGVGQRLAERGFLVGAVRPPTVADGTSRLRIAVSAAHTASQVADLADALAAVMRE